MRYPALADPADRERVHARMMAALEASPENQVEVLKDCLSTLFGVDIIRIIKYLGDPPGYYMETKQGNITIGNIDKIPSQPKFREAVMSVTNVLVPKVSGRVWDQRIQAILSACEDIEGGDANHLALETRRWVEDYLLEKPPREEDWEKAVSAKIPFVRKRATYMFVEDFQRWLELNVNLQLDDHEIGRRLRQIGMERKSGERPYRVGPHHAVHMAGARQPPAQAEPGGKPAGKPGGKTAADARTPRGRPGGMMASRQKNSLYSARGKNDYPPSKNRKARQQAIQPFIDQFVLLFSSVTPS